jgi:hypothetical protein
VIVKAPANPPGDLFAPARRQHSERVLLSQGEVRPGVVQGPYYGRRRLPPGPPCPVPESYADPRLANRMPR